MEQFLGFFGTLRWQDLADIVLNSYILFRLYVLFRGTNAFRILVGIAALWILHDMAAALGLILTSWVLQGITAAAAIIIVVVFRNEIRSALYVHNLKTFLWGMPKQETFSPIETIADTCYELGKKRIGALIVIPGREDLSEILHGGISWDGKVSREMLMSIFWPKNPVHDGAVIISGNRITEVGAYLPLSQRPDLPTFYGTRHRAAAGLSERTDAMVIAVSEERGRVTVAKEDWIKPVGQADELLGFLRKHLNLSADDDTQKVRAEKIKQAVAIVLSFIIMTGVWFGFTRGRATIIAVEVPIEYASRPGNLEILDTGANTVVLQLTGPSAILKSLSPSQVEVRLPLDKAVEGVNAFPITAENISLPPGVFVNKVDPPAVEVTLDVLVARQVPVQAQWIGHLNDDLILKKVTVEPSSVKVMGGKKILEALSTLYTAPIRINEVTKSGSVTAPIVLTPASLKLPQGTSDRVSVTFIVEKRPVTEPAEKPAEEVQNP